MIHTYTRDAFSISFHIFNVWPITSAANLHLSPDQAIGKVASAEANFMRVVVELEKSEKILSENEGNGVELLCVVRNLLKKIKRRVLVGEFHALYVEELISKNCMLSYFKIQMVISWKSKLRSWGYEPVFCSVETKTGLDTLQFNLRDQTSVIVGPSGVGKSSLINALRSNQFGFGAAELDDWSNSILGSKWLEDQRVGEVAARSGRGKHTTRHVSLLPLSGGGYVADTPGFNQPSLLKVTKQSLALCFPETSSVFRYKAGDMGIMQAEPRLQPKKHRRTSRKKMNQSFLDDVEAELEYDEDESFLEDDPIVKAMENENQ
uniref:small ribosomal subunit biogenesis GTPase RsgA 1, mitochondrial-like n=1 Tax=Erigeron canadensis TaxID=72917 RepID=UPI001CB93578|nr:small ribosomal subunit biogenesis GTPase RsgA 1, mitochondrial-like [Erigeron canadensis]